jgi:hypothetical protein
MANLILGIQHKCLTPASNNIHNLTRGGKHTLNRQETIAWCEKHISHLTESAKFCKALNRECGLVSATIAGAIHYLIAEKHSLEKANAFIHAIYTGENASPVISAFRKQMVKLLTQEKSKKGSSIYTLNSLAKITLLAKAWKSHNQGTCPALLSVKPSDQFPEI